MNPWSYQGPHPSQTAAVTAPTRQQWPGGLVGQRHPVYGMLAPTARIPGARNLGVERGIVPPAITSSDR